MGTINHRLAEWAEERPDDIAQRFKTDGVWKAVTTKEFSDRVFFLGLYLESKGLTSEEDVLTIFSYNCPQWPVADLAPGLVGSISAGVYPNSSPKDVQYILNLTGSKIVVLQDKRYYDKMIGDQEFTLPESVEELLVIDGDTSFHPKAKAFSEALKEGQALAHDKKLRDYLDRIDTHRPAYIVFTSGTTGHPKGAMISHDNLVYSTDLIVTNWQLTIGEGSMFSFLPICHIAEKLQTVGVSNSIRSVVNYATSIDHVAKELGEVQPTILLCVPRLWEKMMSGVRNKLGAATGFKKKLADWAFAVAKRKADSKYADGAFGIKDQLEFEIANKLVLNKVRDALGLSRAEYAASGAAPLPQYVAQWFWQLGIEILEDYGQSESTAVICITVPGKDCTGTVGIPAPGTEFKLLEDGEICSKGRHIFKGYFKNPKATAETLQDGWLLTGDLAKKTDEGYIRIVGRKKEILKTSGGKMVAPVPIEEKIKQSSLVSQVCMVGEGRKYFSALVTLTEDHLQKLSDENLIQGETIADEKTIALIKAEVDAVNATLASFERIKYFRILSRDFLLEKEEMTPTLKMKRAQIENSFKAVIDEMYHGETSE